MKEITQEDMARVLNVTQPTVSKRIDKKSFRCSEMLKLENELGIPFEAFRNIKSYLDCTKQTKAS